jgi:hypothetical protein
MKSVWHRGVPLVGVCVIAIFSVSRGIASADPNEVLKKQLMEIRAGGRTIAEDSAALESRALQLIRDHNTPSEKGMIYATIASVYSDRGFGSSDEGQRRAGKTIEYAKKALDYPLDVLTACRVYGRLTGGLSATGMRGAPKDRWREVRREAVVPCLKGLKLALDNKAPRERPKPPPQVPIPSGPTFDERVLEEWKRKHEGHALAVKQYWYLSELYEQRWALTQRCAGLYSSEPYDLEEFRSYAQKYLGGHDEVVKDLVQLVESRIAVMRGPVAQPSGPKP